MVREIKDRNLFSKLRSFSSSPFFIPVLFLLFLIITVPVITLITSNRVDIRQRAASQGLTSTINIEPGSGSVAPNQQFTADLVINGGGQPFNAAQADVSVGGNVTVQSVEIVPVEQGGCGFTFANQNATPSVSNLSFAGAILNGSSTQCTLFTVTLIAGNSGSGNISISNSQVKSSDDSAEIFLSSQNGLFTISTGNVPPLPQSVMYLSPNESTIVNGTEFAVEVRIDTNGQTVNAVESQISYPTALLDVVSIDDTSSDFNVAAEEEFSNGTINIAYGSITPKSGDILVTKVSFVSKASGIASVNFVNPKIISNVSNTDVLKNSINGTYTISASPTAPVTPTSAPTASPQPTSGPTSTPQPTSPPTSTPVPPTPTSALPTTTPVPNAPTLTLNSVPGATYKSTFTLSGAKSVNAESIFVNNTTQGVNYPSSTSWEYNAVLNLGVNSFAIYPQTSGGVKGITSNISIARYRTGDITGDNLIDLTDLSIFGSDWAKTSSFNNILSDMNDDGAVNLTDFSIFAKAYGN